MSKVIKAHKSLEMEIRRLSLPETAGEGDAPEETGPADFASLIDLIGGEDEGEAPAPSDSTPEASGEETKKSPPDPVELARKEAEAILKKAREEADVLVKRAKEMVEHSRQEAELLESKAYEQGFEQGKKDGEELGRKQLEVAAQRLNSVIEAIRSQGVSFLNKYEGQLIKLTMEAVHRIVLRQIELDPSLVIDALKGAFEKVIEGSKINIHLNPKDVELVTEFLTRDQELAASHPVDVIPDPSISQGGCLVETEFGLVDATVETRIEAVRQEISKILKERTGYSL